MRRKHPYSCGLGPALDVIGGKWKPAILYHLAMEKTGFAELCRKVSGISEKMLHQQLRELEGDGVVTRKIISEIPIRVEYDLTERGRSLNEAVLTLTAWGAEQANLTKAREAVRRMDRIDHAA